MDKVFSLPINPKFDPQFIETKFLDFLIRNKDYIFDLYFTCRMPPFTQDAMGEVFMSQDMELDVIGMANWLSQESGIPLSATFNNIYVRPDQKGLDEWIVNFKQLYDLGIKIVTLPHTSWVMTGQIQKEYPELYIKNTILREVTRPNEIVELARAGFHYINLDRDLMRDRNRLIEIKEAKEYCAEKGYPVKISLLVNEGCWGNCPIMPEHYHYNNTRNVDDPQYFNSRISRISCSKWDALDGAASLKAANLPPWKEDWEEMLDLGIDVFKMHGRESASRLMESMDIINRWALDKDILFPQYKDYIEDVDLKERPIDVWREKIKTCQFNCWKCNYCDKVYESGKGNNKVHPKIPFIIDSIDKAEKKESNYTGVSIEALTSDITRNFLNNICSYEGTKYLEVGVYAGGTFYSALQNNNIKVYAIDDFEKAYATWRDDIEFVGHKDPKKAFLQPPWWPDKRYDFELLEGKVIDITVPEKCNVIFYDADHDPLQQYKNINHLLQFCEDEFILLVDDANMPGVVESVEDLVKHKKLNVLFERKILTSIPEDQSSWWNGIYILLIQK